MNHDDLFRRLVASRRPLSATGAPETSRGEGAPPPLPAPLPPGSAATKREMEGGCGVIGLACTESVRGLHLLEALAQMRNRGNGKGGGIAAVGLEPTAFGVDRYLLERDYLLTVAYLDVSCRNRLEGSFIRPTFVIDHVRDVPALDDPAGLGLQIRPPQVGQYFVRLREEVRRAFAVGNGLEDLDRESLDDEIVFQNSLRINRAFYAGGALRAFVLSHGRDQMILKMVGHANDVVRWYRLEDFRARVWIGHHRYPTRGRVWHPGGAHPFAGMHDALVHNGDFANYAAMCEHLAQRNLEPLFATDTEVAALAFDFLQRTCGYPLEYVVEALAPTTELDFTRLDAGRRQAYRALQAVHMSGSPDGPWFFLIAGTCPAAGPGRAARLVGITDTSMLRPQVFALHEGEGVSIGLAASEKQVIDAVLRTLSAEDGRFRSSADLYWSARGGSHTDGGAFVFRVEGRSGDAKLVCTDKFGREIRVEDPGRCPASRGEELRPARRETAGAPFAPLPPAGGPADPLNAGEAVRFVEGASGAVLEEYAVMLVEEASRQARHLEALYLLARLVDCQTCHRIKPGRARSILERAIESLCDRVRSDAPAGLASVGAGDPLPEATGEAAALFVDACRLSPEGSHSAAALLIRAHRRGWRRFILFRCRGHRFLGNGLGPAAGGVRIDVFGSPGDYLGSGIDGPEIHVHGSAQDQVAQILRSGKLVIHGDVGQAFGYGAKGGHVYVRGDAGGRPLINAVGCPRVVINGRCLDYLAESFMAGDPLDGGGFCILNGVRGANGRLEFHDEPYPGGNLFSLASGGCIYVRDPAGRVCESQLNGGRFVDLTAADWEHNLAPHLEENERLFGIPLAGLLEAGGRKLGPEQVYRKIVPSVGRALSAEEAWVAH